MEENKDYSLLIAKTITKYFTFKQARLSMYHKDDIYYRIPRLIFRLEENIDISKYTEIKACIESFVGNLKWTIYKYDFSRKDNYVMAPSILYEIERDYYIQEQIDDEKQIINKDEYKLICEKAIEDIPRLAEYIDKYFSTKYK